MDDITRYILFEEKINRLRSEGIIPEVTVDMVGDRMLVTLGKQGQAAVGAAAVLGTVYLVAKLLAGSVKFYKDRISRYGKQCKDFKHGSPGRVKCERRVKAKALYDRAKLLSNSKQECKKTKDPAKCSQKLDQKVNELKMKASQIEKSAQSIKSKEGR